MLACFFVARIIGVTLGTALTYHGLTYTHSLLAGINSLTPHLMCSLYSGHDLLEPVLELYRANMCPTFSTPQADTAASTAISDSDSELHHH